MPADRAVERFAFSGVGRHYGRNPLSPLSPACKGKRTEAGSAGAVDIHRQNPSRESSPGWACGQATRRRVSPRRSGTPKTGDGAGRPGPGSARRQGPDRRTAGRCRARRCDRILCALASVIFKCHVLVLRIDKRRCRGVACCCLCVHLSAMDGAGRVRHGHG